MKCNVHEIPGRAVTSMDGRWVVVPSIVSVFIPEKLTFHIIGVMEVGEDGLAHHVQAFWGVTDTHVAGPAAHRGRAFHGRHQALTQMGDMAKGSASPA